MRLILFVLFMGLGNFIFSKKFKTGENWDDCTFGKFPGGWRVVEIKDVENDVLIIKKCGNCGAGYFCSPSEDGKYVRTRCPSGKTTFDVKSKYEMECGVDVDEKLCEPGHFQVGHNGNCVRCTPGFYCNGQDGVEHVCPVDSGSRKGAKSALDCWCYEDGMEMDPESRECIETCHEGFVCNEEGKEVECKENHYCTEGKEYKCPEKMYCEEGKKYSCPGDYYCFNGKRFKCPDGINCFEGVQYNCRYGFYCVNGEELPCPEGNFYCKDGKYFDCPKDSCCRNGILVECEEEYNMVGEAELYNQEVAEESLKNIEEEKEDRCHFCANGICDENTNECMCFGGYSGSNCDDKIGYSKGCYHNWIGEECDICPKDGTICNVPHPVLKEYEIIEGFRGVSVSTFKSGGPQEMEIIDLPYTELVLDALVDFGATHIRTYGFESGLEQIPELARELGLGIFAGIYITWQWEIDINSYLLKAIKNTEKGDVIILGNELFTSFSLDQQPISAETMIEKLSEMALTCRHYGRYVAYSDIPSSLYEFGEKLAKYFDIFLINSFYFFEQDSKICASNFEEAKFAIRTLTHVRKLEKLLSRPVLIGETGWPSSGCNITICSEKMQNDFWNEMYWEMRSSKIFGFIFSAVDEHWRSSYSQNNPIVCGGKAYDVHWGLMEQTTLRKKQVYKELKGLIKSEI